ncbi:membrane protein [Christiangramia forsetii KT0803]|uniref:Membrane protein n=2 Tax=Christiangramia forsetii TaxID=411153 RepID=A0LZX0_CHRFK|nr:membrane protein [Christiangramia forsetii KT0803]
MEERMKTIENFLKKYTEKPNSTFKRLFVTFLFGFLPFALFFSILSFLEVEPVSFNGEEYYGFRGTLIVMIATPISAFIFSIFIYIYLLLGYLVLNGLKKILIN